MEKTINLDVVGAFERSGDLSMQPHVREAIIV